MGEIEVKEKRQGGRREETQQQRVVKIEGHPVRIDLPRGQRSFSLEIKKGQAPGQNQSCNHKPRGGKRPNKTEGT